MCEIDSPQKVARSTANDSDDSRRMLKVSSSVEFEGNFREQNNDRDTSGSRRSNRTELDVRRLIYTAGLMSEVRT